MSDTPERRGFKGEIMKFIIENIMENYKDEDICLIADKMKAISDNNFIFKIFAKNCSISCDLMWAIDEFHISLGKDAFTLEVVTEDVAIANDKEELNSIPCYKNKLNSYKVGEGLSSYRRLGNSKFYYREL